MKSKSVAIPPVCWPEKAEEIRSVSKELRALLTESRESADAMKKQLTEVPSRWRKIKRNLEVDETLGRTRFTEEEFNKYRGQASSILALSKGGKSWSFAPRLEEW